MVSLKGRLKFSAVCYSLAALMAFVFGVIYLFRSEFMPYHADALERQWEAVDVGTRSLVIALMRVAAGGWIAGAFSLTVLAWEPLQRGRMWARVSAPVIGLAFSVPTLYAVLLLRRATEARPPVLAAALSVALVLTGALASLGGGSRGAVQDT